MELTKYSVKRDYRISHVYRVVKSISFRVLILQKTPLESWHFSKDLIPALAKFRPADTPSKYELNAY